MPRRTATVVWLGFALVGVAVAWDRELHLVALVASCAVLAIAHLRSHHEGRRVDASDREARQASRILDSLVENMPHHIVIKDASLRYVRLNRAAEQFLGRFDLIGKTVHELYPAALAAQLELNDRRAIESGDIVDMPDLQSPTPSGLRWFHAKKIPIAGEDGRMQYVVTITEDVDDRHQMEAKLQLLNTELADRIDERTVELERSQAQLVHAQKMEAVGRLAGGIAHDFNNLLTVIVGHTEMLCDGLPEGDPMRADLEDVRAAGERAAGLTRQLLAFSRRQVLAPKVVSLNDVIGGMHKLLRRVIGEDVELRTIESPTALPVCVDPGQIEQVLMNLAVNARDAMPRGGTLTLAISSVELDGEKLNVPAGSYTSIRVTDSGYGMDELTKARVFEPFFTTKALGKGTGLGLSMVFGIVRQSGGAISVVSEPGAGATFELYFPVASAERPTRALPQRAVLPRGTESVLLVEDEDGVRSLVRNALNRCGYRVLEASDGEQALRVSAEHSGDIDLLLSDVVMPRMSGGELLAKVAATRPHMKVLFMSGYTDDTIIHHGIDRDFAFIQKPVTSDQLMRKIRAVLEA